MKPSSSSLGASSSSIFMVSSLGISSPMVEHLKSKSKFYAIVKKGLPRLLKMFSSSANMMVPFSFLSYNLHNSM